MDAARFPPLVIDGFARTLRPAAPYRGNNPRPRRRLQSGLGGVYNKSVYLDQRRDALERARDADRHSNVVRIGAAAA
jgi:hypothetical protein